MKTYTKTRIHKLVIELMNPKAEEMEVPEMLRWISMMPAIRADMTTVMRMVIFSTISGGMVRRHLGQIRKECSHLLDVLYQYPEFPERSRPLYQSVLDCLLSVMEELSGKYGKYLDSSDLMPIHHYRLAAIKIEESVGPLVSAMSTYHADKTLQSLVIGKMTTLRSEHTDTWYRLDYLAKLQARILELCKGQPRNISDQLMTLLLKVNFNTEGFIMYCKSKIERDLAEHYDSIEKYYFLLSYKRELELLYYGKRTGKFDLQQPDTSDVLQRYADAQLTCLDGKKVLEKPAVVVASAEAWERLPIGMSVDVLAYFFKLLVKVGVLKDVKKTWLVAFISRSFRTPGVGTANLSVQSLESKYRQVTNSSAVTLKSILLSMLKQLDDEFG